MLCRRLPPASVGLRLLSVFVLLVTDTVTVLTAFVGGMLDLPAPRTGLGIPLPRMADTVGDPVDLLITVLPASARRLLTETVEDAERLATVVWLPGFVKDPVTSELVVQLADVVTDPTHVAAVEFIKLERLIAVLPGLLMLAVLLETPRPTLCTSTVPLDCKNKHRE